MKNYIEEDLRELGVEEGVRFIVRDGENRHECVMNKHKCFVILSEYIDSGKEDRVLLSLLKGDAKIEKIKPKTLMQQLKEQGGGYAITYQGNIHYRDILYVENEVILNGNFKLTKTDAEREVYRRQLEFEMQEWARENDCLEKGDPDQDLQVFNYFNLYLKDGEKRVKFENEFCGGVVKYNKWGSEEC